MNVRDLARSDSYILRPRDFDDPNAGQAFSQFEERGVLLRVWRGAYVLVPEASRRVGTPWRPPIERVALGLASVVHGVNRVALIGPSAARVHGCLPRSLPRAMASYPSTRTRRVKTIVGTVELYARSIERMDVVRFNSDLGNGMVTGVEMTMLDLVSGAAKWSIEDSDLAEAVRLLAVQSNWQVAEKVAMRYRRTTALKSLSKFGVER